MNATVCEYCHENPAIKMAMILVRTQSTFDGKNAAGNLQARQVPICEECLSERECRPITVKRAVIYGDGSLSLCV